MKNETIDQGPTEDKLHIFINRRKYTDGVKPEMSGRELARLAKVPEDNAIIRRDHGSENVEIAVGQIVPIKQAEHFLITRRNVEGGAYA